MTDGIKGCRQVEEDEDGEESGISCHEKVIGDFDECCFSVVEWTETRLELFIEVIVGKVKMELGGNCFFEDFGDEG